MTRSRTTLALRRQLLCSVFILSCPIVALKLSASVASCDKFNHGRSSLYAADHMFRHSTLVISYGSKMGTAFLIEKELKLFLSAYHTVENWSADSTSDQIEGYGPSQSQSKQPHVLSVVSFNKGLDVALLQQIEGPSLDAMTAFELSYGAPRSQRIGFLGATFGEPKAPSIVLRTSDGFRYSHHGDNLMQIVAPVGAADSGAPVLKDTNGLVIGVIIKRQSDNFAYARPIADISDFLEAYIVENMPPVISDFGEQAEISADQLSEMFRVTPQKSLSNLHLMGLILSNARKEEPAVFPSVIGGCEILMAAINRELNSIVGHLGKLASASSEDGAISAFRQAESQQVAGNTEVALALYEFSIELFGTAIEARLSEEGGVGLLTPLLMGSKGAQNLESLSDTEVAQYMRIGASLASKAVPEAHIEDPVSWEVPRQRDVMGRLLHDYQTALIRTSQLSPKGFSNEVNERILICGAWGVQVSRSPHYQALHYTAIGDTLLRLRRPGLAIHAYASAWSSGVRTPAIQDSFEYSRGLAAYQAAGQVQGSLGGSIEDSSTLDSALLYGIVSDYVAAKAQM